MLYHFFLSHLAAYGKRPFYFLKLRYPNTYEADIHISYLQGCCQDRVVCLIRRVRNSPPTAWSVCTLKPTDNYVRACISGMLQDPHKSAICICTQITSVRNRSKSCLQLTSKICRSLQRLCLCHLKIGLQTLFLFHSIRIVFWFC